ncbi:MAG TPA: orotidine-5'-phosphate decarboxylase [Ignavibacteriaceae bacterium]|nr:orotidine-5'-phosphate decarboxylase [Ignavibacteriaceae bacterium]
MTALEKFKKKNSELKFICIGLDTDLGKIPIHLKSLPQPIYEFNKAIIEKTWRHAAAYKLNFGFYERYGAEGFEILEKTIKLIPEDILIIGDSKRGDIGSTSQMYAKAVFDYFKCDAVTLNPYMGEDSLLPFLIDPTRFNFILTLTSNPGSEDIQKLKLEDGSFLYQRIIRKARQWNKKNNCGIVFGATKVEELKENIQLIDELPVLLPGVGAQGGSFEDILAVFKKENKFNFLVNLSRSIIYKKSGLDFAEGAEEEIKKLNSLVQTVFS